MLVHQESGSLLLRVRPEALAEIKQYIPKHREILAWGHNLAVKFGIDEVRVLRNLGIRAPSPILYDYDWPGKFTALDHQQDTASLLTIYRRAFVLNETGTMKTASALWAADYLMRRGLVKRVLIAAKLSTLKRVWLEEIFNVLMHRSAVIVHDSREKRLEKLKRDVDFYIINHEGVELVADELRRRKDIELIIYDEASELRNAGTNKWKEMNALVNPYGQQSHHRLWLMTATPCPNAPTDSWALARLVSPMRVPAHFNAWKRATMLQVSTYKWIPKHGSSELAFNAMHPAVRYRKQDCLQLPPLVTEEREVPLSKQQVEYYEEMRLRLVAETQAGAITAANAGDKINKLRQILCGAIRFGDIDYVRLDHAPRLKVLLECIQEAAAKVIVIVPFKGITRYLAEEVAEHYSCAVLNGDVSITKRDEIISAFKMNEDPRVLLCHPKVMAHGLNLTEADTTIFYAPIYSNDEAMQVIERFNRPGQTRKMTVIRMGAAKLPLEWSIYRQIDDRQEGQASILDLYQTTITQEAR